MPESAAVRDMFADIAGRYDLANHVLSGGLDLHWRRILVARVREVAPRRVADLATGSGDVALALRRGLPMDTEIIGLDFCSPMLQRAEAKKARNPRYDGVRFGIGDCLALPLEDNAVDAVTIAFGLRNLEDRARGLAEMRRVLRPGGRLCCLEFTQPARWFRPVYYLYLKHVLPHLAGILTRNRNAYDYLVGSIGAFPEKERLLDELDAAGFIDVRADALSASIVAIHIAHAPPEV